VLYTSFLLHYVLPNYGQQNLKHGRGGGSGGGGGGGSSSMDQVIQELKQKVSAKTQTLSTYRKRQILCYHNKTFTTDCKKFYNFTGRQMQQKRRNTELLKRNIWKKASIY
jgi:hypothetical protein